MSIAHARLLSLAGRALAAVALAAAAGVLQAQTAPESAANPAPRLNLQLPAEMPASADAAAVSSSVTAEEPLTTEVAANETNQFHFLNAMQYGGGRQRYGRPRYRGGNTNADGSPKYNFFVGGGVGLPVGNYSNYLTPSWAFQVGGGRNFDKHLGVNVEFNYDNFGMTGGTIANQSLIYFNNSSNPYGLDANSHIWSFSIDPIFTLYSGEGMGAYVTGGVGFYHKVANFTLPATGTYCDPYYGFCYQYTANQIFDHYTSNAPGFNVGFGLTYKISKFASEQLYAEVRYVYVANQYRSGVTVSNYQTAPLNATNFFPENSQHTSYLPVKFGLRF